MNILQVSSGRAFGGGERHVLELVAALAARGHRLHVATPADGRLAQRLSAAGIRCVHHPVVIRRALDLGALRQLLTLVERERIDIVHAHYARDYPTVAGIVRWRRWQDKCLPALFLTRHHYVPLTRNWLYGWWLSVAERLIAVSEYVRAKAQASLGWDAARLVVIPNWVDAERFRRPRDEADRQQCRRRFGLPGEAFLIGCLNRLEAAKGQAMLLFALEVARRRIQTLHVALAGDGDEAYVARLRQQARTAGLTHHVSFLGFVDEAPDFLASCDVVAIPSQDEAFSLGVLEAWATGVPVVVSDVGGLAELVVPEETGLRVGARDVRGWADALCRLATDASLRQRLVAGGRYAVQRYTQERAVTAIEALYHAALVSRR